MSEYKFVQWGKGIPVDYQRLGQMVSNEQYLKDKFEHTPRGLLMWKQTSGTGPINASGSYQAITGFTSLPFDVEENRSISFFFDAGLLQSNVSGQIRFKFIIDSTSTEDISGSGAYYNGLVQEGYSHAGACLYFSPTALAKGSHTVSVQMIADASMNAVYLGNYTTMIIAVRDEGAYVSETT